MTDHMELMVHSILIHFSSTITSVTTTPDLEQRDGWLYKNIDKYLVRIQIMIKIAELDDLFKWKIYDSGPPIATHNFYIRNI